MVEESKSVAAAEELGMTGIWSTASTTVSKKLVANVHAMLAILAFLSRSQKF